MCTMFNSKQFNCSALIHFRFVFIVGKQTMSYPCGAFTLKEGEQAGRKIDVGTISGTEKIVAKIILYVYTHV